MAGQSSGQLDKSQSQKGQKVTCVTTEKVTHGMTIRLYNDDVATSQGATWHDRTTDWAGDVAIMHIKWTNCVLTRGRDRPMRG
jgi:hypothetical protein